MELFQKAAALDEVYALFRLGEFCRDAKYGFKQDGHIAAEIYTEGCGSLLPNRQKALEFYRQSAESGYSFAKERLSELTGSDE